MDSPHSAPPPEDLALLFRIVREVTTTKRLSPEDAEDFSQSVQVRLVERGYDLFHRFKGQSTLRTYLQVVVRRLLLDWQNREYGRWRPSLQAMRLGVFAVELERLMYRDSYTAAEAIQIARLRAGAPPAGELERTAGVLTPRARRRKVSDELLLETRGVDFEDPLAERENQLTEARIRQALAGALGALPAEDRELLHLRYAQSRSVQAVAQGFAIEPKKLYRRFDRVLRSLRETLAQQGVTGPRSLDPAIEGRAQLAG